MKSCVIHNKIVIIGGDHHNTLAVVRDLGRHNCTIHILLHCGEKSLNKVRLSYSKYARNRISVVANSENDIIQWLRTQKFVNGEKIILFPCSDLAAYTIDIHYKELSEFCILPGFINDPGRIAYLMNKRHQKEFADKNGIPMAKTWEFVKTEEMLQIPENMVYPCIIKPEISAFGNKDDIKICENEEELKTALGRFLSENYERVIVQQFLEKEYEVCSYGCLINSHPHQMGGDIRKIREWPSKGGGSLTLAQFIDNADLGDLRNHVQDILYQQGYRGQYDIEFLVCEDKIYLNEINFRHSGNGYGLVQNGVSAPYIWCLDVVGQKVPNNLQTSVVVGVLHMDELSDFSHRNDNQVSMIEWIRDVMKAKAFSVFSWDDLSGTWGFYRFKIINVINKVLRRG